MSVDRFPIGIVNDLAVGCGAARSSPTRKLVEPVMQIRICMAAIEVAGGYAAKEA